MTHFSPEQQIAFDKYVSGENIFITGPGGSGKSYLIKKIASHAKQNEKKISIYLFYLFWVDKITTLSKYKLYKI